MRVIICGDDGQPKWFRECLTSLPFGTTSEAYRYDGTQQRIVFALREALSEAEVQLSSVFNVTDVVPDVCVAITEVDCCVPVARVGYRNSSRQRTVEAAVITMLTPALKFPEVDIVHEPDVALVRAFHNDNVTGT